MERTFTYRNSLLFFVAFWFSVLGLVFSITALRASLGPGGLMLRMANGTPVGAGPIAWLPVFLPALAVPLGLWLFLFAANSKVVLDTDGVKVYNWSRRLTFQAAWDDIKSVHRAEDARGGYSVAIETAGHTELLTHSLVGLPDLEKYLRDHVSTSSL